jgi:hypothetical protein
MYLYKPEKGIPTDIALLFSGGVESVLMYYLYYQFAKEHNCRLDLITVVRPGAHLDRIKAKYEQMKEYLGDDISTYRVWDTSDVPVPNYEVLRYIIYEINTEYQVVGLGVNEYYEEICPAREYQYQKERIHRAKVVIAPFLDMKKHETISMYKELGIEQFLDYTESCSIDIDNPCGECFNCREIEYALGILENENTDS